MDDMKYSEAMRYIEEAGTYGIVPGLDSIRELCAKVGDPQKELRFVHIAGTNGKGSVLAFLSGMLQAGGVRVGCYISPVLMEYREKIQVNGRPVSRQGICRHLSRIRRAVEEMTAEGYAHPTVFEIETVLGFLYFAEKKCGIVLLETGLGGDLDATNVIPPPEAAVFTSISMDHMQFLGDSLEEIAGHKAGIIKPGCQVVTMSQTAEVQAVLKNRAEEKGCGFFVVEEEAVTAIKYGLERQKFTFQGFRNLEISLAGRHQIRNAALAVEVMCRLESCGFKIREEQLRQGLARAVWRGRFEILGKRPWIIADGAHNEDGAIKLADSLRFYFTNRRIIYIMGVLRDKEYDRILRATCGLAEHIITLTPPANPRALPAYELAREAERCHSSVTVADSVEEAVELACLLAGTEDVIVAFGSLSYLGALTRSVERYGKKK